MSFLLHLNNAKGHIEDKKFPVIPISLDELLLSYFQQEFCLEDNRYNCWQRIIMDDNRYYY